jgi:predicted CxxxxCH...CXXCH cytochrome family protein
VDAGVDGGVTHACAACHGTGALGAPPPDLSGSTDRTRPGVGAHQAHLRPSTWHLEFRCRHCHPVPATTNAPGHLDDTRPADVVFSTLAVVDTPDAGMVNSTCAVYCHGGAMAWDRRVSAAWTTTTPGTCTSCHGMPPGPPHPVASDCGRCHLEVVDSAGTIINRHIHVDGMLMAPKHAHLVHLGGAGGTSLDCTACHAGDDYHAPMKDGKGLEETTVCDTCHAAGTVGPEAWRTWRVE